MAAFGTEMSALRANVLALETRYDVGFAIAPRTPAIPANPFVHRAHEL